MCEYKSYVIILNNSSSYEHNLLLGVYAVKPVELSWQKVSGHQTVSESQESFESNQLLFSCI